MPNNVTAMLKITAQGVEDLRYDNDGDGVFETSLTPTAIVEGAAAADVEGPAITFAGTPQQSTVLLSIAAHDQSGVKAIYYSTDGSNYQQYTTPFVVSSAETSTVSAFADDNVGNRSTYTYDVPRPPSIMAPSNLNLETGAADTTGGVTVTDQTLGNANAVSNSQGTVTVTRSGVAANNLFPVGTTTVTYTATDSNGLIATATQTVNVLDKTAPTISCPDNLVVILPANSTATTAVVNYSPSATDNCGVPTVTSDHGSGSAFRWVPPRLRSPPLMVQAIQLPAISLFQSA
jgi:hypothetical protein